MDADALHALVRSYLEASHRRSNQGDDDVDDAIVVYVAQVVADPDVEAQQAAECICALCPCADSDDALAMVLDGRAITRALADDSNQPAHLTIAPPTSKKPTAENNELETLQWLKELAPQLSLRSIETIYLQECRGDAGRTAEYLVTHYGADETKYLSLSTLQVHAQPRVLVLTLECARRQPISATRSSPSTATKRSRHLWTPRPSQPRSRSRSSRRPRRASYAPFQLQGLANDDV